MEYLATTLGLQTNLSQSIDITANKAKYDESVKELFADKQVLAWILKYTLEEFGDDVFFVDGGYFRMVTPQSMRK